MFWLGKLLGAVFGYMIAGPYGAVFGLLLGHYFDLSRRGHWFFFQTPSQHAQTQAIFFQATFLAMGSIAKADGRVSENEIKAATKIMQKMMLTEQQKVQAIHYFREGKQANFNLKQLLQQLKIACHQQRNLLHLFVEIQVQAAFADGTLTSKKQQILEYMCNYLEVNPGDFFNYSSSYEHAYTYNRQTNYQPSGPSQLEKAYRLLGVATSVNDHDLKKAYRKLMSQNHPDKLISKGLPEEMLKLATQKTQEIKSAYETICKARGI